MRRLASIILLVILCLQPYAASAATRKGSGLVRFQDGNALSDKVLAELFDVTLPENGTHYQGWLGSDDGSRWVDIGTIAVNEKGRGATEWTAPDGQNLIGSYSRFKVTVEANTAAAPTPSASVAYQGAVAADVVAPWRVLLVAGQDTPLPARFGLATQFKEEAKGLNDESRSARDAMRDNSRSRARSKDEQMLNRIVGINDGAWGDWDGDGALENESDTYGIQRYAATIRSVVAPLANNAAIPEDSRIRANAIMTATSLISGQTEQIRNLINVLGPNVNTTDGLVVQRDVVWLTRLALDGYDFNLDGTLERNDGEGGARGVYRSAQDLGRIRLSVVK